MRRRLLGLLALLWLLAACAAPARPTAETTLQGNSFFLAGETTPALSAALSLGELYLESMMEESEERTFRLTAYENVGAGVFRTTEMPETERERYLLSAEEIAENTWVVELSAEILYEGVYGPGASRRVALFTGGKGGYLTACFLLTKEQGGLYPCFALSALENRGMKGAAWGRVFFNFASRLQRGNTPCIIEKTPMAKGAGKEIPMKEKNYTIPINESFEVGSGCPVCRLYEAIKEKTLDYITGAAMMEPDVRQDTNRKGFCQGHFTDMLKRKNRLSVALMLESHLDALEKTCFEDTKGLLGRANDPVKTAVALKKADESCFVCQRIDEYMGHYVANIVYLWQTEPEFRRRFAAQEAFCIPHLHKLLEQGKKSLSKRDLPEFTKEAVAVSRKRHTALRADLAKFTKSFDYRFADEGKEENVKNSVENVVSFLAGKGR